MRQTVAFDVDFTLVNQDGSTNHEVMDYLRLFLRDGYTVVIWSGGGLDYATQRGTKLLGPITMLRYEKQIIFSAKNKDTAEALKPAICFDDEFVDLAKVNLHVVNLTKTPRTPEEMLQCYQCGVKMIPDQDAKIFGTDKWDGHSYKFNCDCVDRNLRVSIG